MSEFLWPHEWQDARLLCLSLSPGVCSNSCPLSWWCHPLLSPSPPALHLSQPQRLSKELPLLIRWPKYWSFRFSNSPSSEYSGLISFRMDWFWSVCSPRDSQESSPTPQFERSVDNEQNRSTPIPGLDHKSLVTFHALFSSSHRNEWTPGTVSRAACWTCWSHR